ncbi:MAG: F0F1 ATP synthase subunit delta [Bacteroidales bacterium]|nr:F0F1 ATP synthase subunit delta [Bacteroidales bacterium]
MNTGVISSRYARALLKYVTESGHGEQVYQQACALLKDPDAAMSAPLEPELERFMALLVENGREDLVKLMLTSFVRMYRESAGILMAHLVTVVPAPEVEAKLRSLLESRTGCRVILDSSVDPSLIGGFTLELGDYMLDASVSRQIETIRRQFIIYNNRLV